MFDELQFIYLVSKFVETVRPREILLTPPPTQQNLNPLLLYGPQFNTCLSSNSNGQARNIQRPWFALSQWP